MRPFWPSTEKSGRLLTGTTTPVSAKESTSEGLRVLVIEYTVDTSESFTENSGNGAEFDKRRSALSGNLGVDPLIRGLD